MLFPSIRKQLGTTGVELWQIWAVVVAQLVERSLLTPEIRGLNPKIGKILSTNCTYKWKRQK